MLLTVRFQCLQRPREVSLGSGAESFQAFFSSSAFVGKLRLEVFFFLTSNTTFKFICGKVGTSH